MPRITNDREQCPDARQGEAHVWTQPSQGDVVCDRCGAERVSRWVPSEADIITNRKEQQ